MEEMRNNIDKTNQDIYYCSRCKIKEAEITCAMCDPFRYFCNNCNEYVHSVPSKKFHVRRKMQDKLLESVNNNPNNDSKLKTSNSSNFKFSENFNKEKFSQVVKDKQFEIKKALENFEFNYSNNRFYNNNNSNDNHENHNNHNNNPYNNNSHDDNYNSQNNNFNFEENKANNYVENNNHDFNLYNSSRDFENKNQEFERRDRGRIRENLSYGTQRNSNNYNNLDNNSKNHERVRNHYSNKSLRRSYEKEYEKANSKSRDNSRRFYNFRKNNTNQEASLSKSPKISYVNSNNDINQNSSGNNYINEIKVINNLLKVFIVIFLFYQKQTDLNIFFNI